MLNVAILISGRGSNMEALVRATQKPGFPARIACVISNNPDAAGLAWAKENSIETAVLDHRPYGQDRQKYEQALDALLKNHGVQLVCLAGFMRLLTSWFTEEWRDRLVNIHPSLLPAFPGLHIHEKVIDYGARFSGCTVHFVRAEMDHGPIIAQAAVPVLGDDDAETLAARVLENEHKLYPQVLAWIAEGRVNVYQERTFITGVGAPESQMNPQETEK